MRESVYVCVCVCVREERVSVCVCVCVYVRSVAQTSGLQCSAMTL